MPVSAALIRAVQHVTRRLRGVVDLIRPPRAVDERRYAYQEQAIRHRFTPGARVLDIGSGGDPFPRATVLADRYLEPTAHRSAAFLREGQPVVICDIGALPFRTGAFDYVVCSHVLEHVDDPAAACRELQRVAAAGFIETPTRMKDILFSWARGMHRWHIVAHGPRLFFFEYTDRELDGLRSSAWLDVILGPVYHPLQTAFAENQDVFNVLFEWEGPFEVQVYRLHGESTA